ncbi:FAD-dependent oxidoreductase [Alcaligenaceae bacterium]|nr:FAD-dependent oxidoreductase [Alcaligenaceae bacterium]
MTIYDATLTFRQDVAEGTTAFHFSRPSGFDYKPGQAIDLILAPASGNSSTEGERHTFSIVSAPFQDELCITTRMRDSAYKRELKSLATGAAVKIEGPFGSLTLHNKASRAGVLIAGGIGITPFMSMLRNAAHTASPQQLLLLYSNRRPEDAAFLHELQELEQKNPYFHMLATMTQMAGSSQPWSGETGVLDTNIVKRAIADLPDPVVYLAGPPAMVAALGPILNGAGIDDDDIRTEEFYGY